MRMVLIIFRETIAPAIHELLKHHGVTAFTELHNVSGRGLTGPTVQFSLSADSNRLILAAVPEDTAHRLITGLTHFRAEYVKQHGGHAVPLHVFILPCEQVL
jgi:nitrogen regulatory protein PII